MRELKDIEIDTIAGADGMGGPPGGGILDIFPGGFRCNSDIPGSSPDPFDDGPIDPVPSPAGPGGGRERDTGLPMIINPGRGGF